MLKYLILFINLVFLFIAKMFVNDNLAIQPVFPNSVKAGSEFVMEVIIQRTNVNGFAKFQQELPKGFTAKALDSRDASFTFNAQTVKLIWTALPAESEFKISYTVMVDKSVSGTQSFGGQFTYIVDNVKKIANFPQSNIQVIPAEAESVNATSTLKDTTKTLANTITQAIAENTTTTNNQQLTTNSLACARSITATNNPGEFLVEVTVNKGSIGGFAKLQENIPAGYTANAVKATNASFTFSEQKAKFVWIVIPEQPVFSVSYTLKSDNITSGEAWVDGLFSYIENDETKKHIIASSSLTNNSNNNNATPIANNLTTTTINTSTAIENAEPIAQQEAPASTTSLETTAIPAPEKNVVYKVQIAAMHKMVNVSYFKEKNNITAKISTEMHQGWTKYTVGSFNEYKLARDHREEVRLQKIEGPFVTAYNAGQRITVQEALMITSQKWYK